MSDRGTESLVEASRAGNRAAFGELVLKFAGLVKAMAIARVRHWEDAQDVAQEVFVEAFFSLSKLREPEAFAAWLKRIVVKQADRVTRRRHVRADHLTESAKSELPGPEEAAETNETKKIVMDALATLSRSDREVVLMYYMQAESLQDLAEFSGVSVDAVKMRLHRARAKLKGRLLTMAEEMLSESNDDDAAFAKRVQRAIDIYTEKGPATGLVGSAWDRRRNAQTKQIIKSGEIGAKTTRRLAMDNHAKVRRAAALQIGLRKQKREIPELLKLMKDPSPRVREMAVAQYAAIIHPGDAIGFFEIGSPAPRIVEGLEPLAEMLNDVNVRVRMKSLAALGAYAGLGSAVVDEALKRSLDDSVHKVRHAAAGILGIKCPGCGNDATAHSRRVRKT